MNDTSFASLSPSLLARKGGAKPAMRPQLATVAPPSGPAAAANLEDLGWNDMGEDDPVHSTDVVHLTPAPHNDEADAETRANDEEAAALLARPGRPEVHRQQETIARAVASAPVALASVKTADPVAEQPKPKARAARTTRGRRSALDRGERAAFTLRLDSERHLKLRLACTIRNRSAQQIVTEALDALMGDMPELAMLAAQVQRR
jgi:hypothetical protein